MDPDELLKLLDLGARPPRPPDEPPPVTPDREPPGVTSPTALDVDAWGLRRGRDLAAESDRLRAAGTDAFAAADFFAAAFEPEPRLLDGACADPLRREYIGQLLDTPDYRSLHTATRLDDTAAAIAAVHLAEQFAKLARDEGASTGDPTGREMATLRAVGRAVAEAGKEVGELHEAASALGIGPGSPGANDPRAVAALFKRVRNDPGLRRICDLAGRFRRVAQSKQRLKATHGLDDVVGVEPGGDVGRLLPVELAKLTVPELELDTLRRIAEREALCREYHATGPAGKGPVVCVVDESGSMEGPKAHTAKALALALAWVARAQRRWCGLIAYSGDSGERLLALPPGRWNESALCDWLAAFIGRGSDLDLPVKELPRMFREIGAPPGITDVVFVTDAQARVPAPLKDAFLRWKASARARVVSLVLAASAGDLKDLSDEVHTVRSLDPAGDAAGRVLSL
ncbi:MAG: hypothetical protein C0501_14285 [Isosphaera sp.]|nr:hypothetical protein [Isosphaera sp.]